jgi:hypothetical protein
VVRAVRRLGLLCLLTGACASSAEPSAAALVSVSGDVDVLSKLRSVKVALYAVEATDEATPAKQWNFPSTGGADAVLSPFSFGIVQGTSDRVRLVVRGYGTRAASEPALIEQKLIVGFHDRETVPVQVYLTSACFARAPACDGLGVTCWSSAHAGVGAGQCGPTPSTDVPFSDPPPATLDGGKETLVADAQVSEASVDAALDAAPHAGPADPARAEAGVDGGLPPQLEGECAELNVCTLAAYPCVASATAGYSCLGQLAEWPMPDALPGAKVAPNYDFTSAPGLVLDNVTGLVWQRELPKTYAGCTATNVSRGDSCTWSEAKAYCAQLGLAGRRWRLPGLIELLSILDETRVKPAIDSSVFPGTPGDGTFWTASPNSKPGRGPTQVSFGDLNTNSGDESSAHLVRCVSSTLTRLGRPQDRYKVDTQNSVISDRYSGLVWSRWVSPTSLTSAEAASYCSGLGPGFRVPALKELVTLIDPARSQPAQDPSFPLFDDSWFFWSASPDVGGMAKGLFVLFVQGSVHTQDSIDMLNRIGFFSSPPQYHVRCVR